MATDITYYKEKDALICKSISRKEEASETSEIVIVDTKGNEEETRKIVNKLNKSKVKIIVKGSDNTFNRRVLETMKIDFLLEPETENKRDNLKQRDSGLNQVLGKIATKKGVGIIINARSIIDKEPQKKTRQISRIIQNIKILRKTNTSIKIASFAKNKNQLIPKEERMNLLISWGCDTKSAKSSVKF